MPLITCPDCGRDGVSARAAACPNCGCPIASSEIISEVDDDSQEDLLARMRLETAARIGHVKSMKDLAMLLWKDGTCEDEVIEDIVHWSDQYVKSLMRDHLLEESTVDEVSEMCDFVLRMGSYYPNFRRLTERTVRGWQQKN